MNTLNTMKSILLAITMVISAGALAAPAPATSTSAVIQKSKGRFYSDLGFHVDSGNSNWIHTKPPKNSKFIVTMYKAPSRPGRIHPALTVRVEKLRKKFTLKSYVRKWLREYPKFGFDVLGAKSFKMKKNKGFVIDLINQDSQKQLRQVVFMKDAKAVVMTCRDDRTTFNESLKSCNSIIRTFRWVQ